MSDENKNLDGLPEEDGNKQSSEQTGNQQDHNNVPEISEEKKDGELGTQEKIDSDTDFSQQVQNNTSAEEKVPVNLSKDHGVKFDTQTGEPLPEGAKFDTQTGEPLPEGAKFDTQTGKPLPEGAKFDTQTGKPLPEGAKFDTQTGKPLPEGAKFDTQTGEPLPEGAKFDTQTGEPLQPGTAPQAGRKKITGIVIAVIAVVLIGTLALGMSMIRGNKDPKTAVMDAFETTFNSAAEESYFNKELGISKIYEMAEKNGLKQSFELLLKGGNSYYVNDEIRGAGIRLDMASDPKNKQMRFDISAIYKGTAVIDGFIYGDADKIAFGVPALYNGYFSFAAENIGKQFNESIFGQNSDFPMDENYSIELFPEEGQQAATGADIIERYKTAYKEDINAAYGEIKVEKIDGKLEMEIGNKLEKCIGYTVTIPQSALKTYIRSFGEFVQEDEAIREYFVSAATASTVDSYYYTDPEVVVSEAYEDMKIMFDELYDLINGDASFNIYLDKKGRIVKFTAEGALEQEDYEPVEYTLEGTMNGGNNLFDQVDVVLDMYSDGEYISFEFTKDTNETADIIEGEIGFVIYSDTDTMSIFFNGDYIKQDGTFDCSLIFSDGYESFAINTDGAVKDIKKGEGFTIEMDNLSFEENGTDSIVFEGRYSIGQRTEPIVLPESEEIELFKMTQADLMKVFFSVSGKMNSIMKQFY